MPHSASDICCVRLYVQALERRPIATKSATSAVLSVLASVIAQTGHHRLSWIQLRNEAVIGFALRGALVHSWHRLLNQIAPLIMDTSRKPKFLVAVVKMFIDQVVFAPTMTFLYLVLCGLLNGRTLRQTYTQLKNNFLQILQKNYQIWPIAILFNFNFVSQKFQVVFSNIVSFFWTVYLISKTQATSTLSPTEHDRQYFKERSD